jgi:hypothetical protein
MRVSVLFRKNTLAVNANKHAEDPELHHPEGEMPVIAWESEPGPFEAEEGTRKGGHHDMSGRG